MRRDPWGFIFPTGQAGDPLIVALREVPEPAAVERRRGGRSRPEDVLAGPSCAIKVAKEGKGRRGR